MNKDFGGFAAARHPANAAMLVAALLCIAASLLTQQVGAADVAKKDSRPSFYLTPLEYDGSQVLNACPAGFHMASVWEIHDPSNLRYDTTRGYTSADSGSGPPSGIGGWIRTGNDASGNATAAGFANCDAWTSNSVSHFGSGVLLEQSWSNPPGAVSPWQPARATCDLQARVWCVED